VRSNRKKPHLTAGEIYDGDGGREFRDDASRVRASVRKTARSLGVVIQADVIEDLVQETFLRFLARRSGKEIACLPAYLARVARNTTIEWLKWRSAQKRDSRLTTSLSEVSTMVSAFPNPEEEAACRDLLADRLARQGTKKPERVCHE
jgi:DNA-directed RNA polymerase specialized sigma24 family protein